MSKKETAPAFNKNQLAEELTKPQPVEPNEVDRLGTEMVARELEAMELRQQNEAQGAQIVGLELRLLSLENS